MNNQPCQEQFILLGFSDRRRLEQILFVFVLVFYLVTLVGNIVIILVSHLDPSLHIPMYFFLPNLSFLDLCFTTSSIPQLLFNLGGPDKTISYTGCAVQIFLFLGLGGTECVLLAVMAYDRFTEICKPLHYSIIMHSQLCCTLVSVPWGIGLFNSLVTSLVTMKLPLCGRCRVKHFLCEMPALIKIACVDTVAVESTVFILSVIIVLVPLSLILISYSYIALAVLRIKSASGRRRPFNTCGSHLTVVSLFYGNIIYMYMQPGNNSFQDHQGKFLTLFYNLVTPMLNPVIYTPRNKDVKGALKRFVFRK
ncbi:olfactory receptor 2W3-like [Trichechus manatus latirostris]|uniref:Olfactory receptor n=1 Tax=Trichechus manatus latirostris TaxID=127582 RepID=A0A2Y9E4Z2_TRIMA|nr:olfactory receptor 2W3-like [Trichechus manatus latirostris]